MSSPKIDEGGDSRRLRPSASGASRPTGQSVPSEFKARTLASKGALNSSLWSKTRSDSDDHRLHPFSSFFTPTIRRRLNALPTCSRDLEQPELFDIVVASHISRRPLVYSSSCIRILSADISLGVVSRLVYTARRQIRIVFPSHALHSAPISFRSRSFCALAHAT